MSMHLCTALYSYHSLWTNLYLHLYTYICTHTHYIYPHTIYMYIYVYIGTHTSCKDCVVYPSLTLEKQARKLDSLLLKFWQQFQSAPQFQQFKSGKKVLLSFWINRHDKEWLSTILLVFPTKFALLLWWVFSPSLLNGGKRITRQHDPASGHLFSGPSGRWAGPGQASLFARVQGTGTCPKHCSAVSTAKPCGSPRSFPVSVGTISIPTRSLSLHTLCSAPHQTSLHGDVTHTRLTITGGFSSRMLAQIATRKPVLTDITLHFPKRTLISDMPKRFTGCPGLHSSLSWYCKRSSSCTRRLSQHLLGEKSAVFLKKLKLYPLKK